MERIDRRVFLKRALKGAAAASASGAGVLFRGCSSAKDLDLVILGGTVYDGSGGPPFRADIGIADGIVKLVGRVPAGRGRIVLEAAGSAVCPGFIDVHDHTAEELLVDPRAESAVRQGVTTLVSGQCGSSPFPLSDEMFARSREDMRDEYGLDVTWRDIEGFLARLEGSGTALNYATFVGHGTVRGAVMGFGDRSPTAEELGEMKRRVGAAMNGGALGLSSGLEYTPGSFAAAEELIELCRPAAASGGLYATHMRNEDDAVLEAVDEALRIARESSIRLQISHLKIGDAANWSKIDELLARLDRARAEGIDLRADRYPYIAGATTLALLFPLWSREGPIEDFLARLEDPALDARLRAALAEEEKDRGTWEKVLISSVVSEANRKFEGLNVLEASAAAGKSPYNFMRDLLVAEKGRVGMISFYGSEEVLERILAHPLVGVGADSAAVAPHGPLGRGKPHPRFYGTFPRVLGRYVRERRLVPLEEMIRKMTLMPAAHLGLVRRGAVRTGWAADLVVFDPERVVDRATFVEPAAYPDGIEAVIVNGRVVVDRGEHTGALPGRVLRKDATGAVA